jgi:hypothetical protein
MGILFLSMVSFPDYENMDSKVSPKFSAIETYAQAADYRLGIDNLNVSGPFYRSYTSRSSGKWQ